jgi:ankyrin repeat protein
MVKNTKKIMVFLLALYFFFFPAIDYAKADYESLDKVLETFVDSRETRKLKEYGSNEEKTAFTKKLEGEVYRPVDEKVLNYLKNSAEYEGKNIITDDFRTPGSDSSSVNTDRDVRILVEAETNRWIEIPTSKWEDIYYEEFAKQTNFSPAFASETQRKKILKEHAEKYRQAPTDRLHLEASRDYSDQYGEAVPRIVKAKQGKAVLHDAEGLALMYMEKADEQLRKAETAADADLKAMHETEAVMQLKKGIITLEELRNSYISQGYEMGKLPENFKSIAAEIKAQDGSGAGLDSLKTKMKNSGFIDSGDFKDMLGSQLGSLKIAELKKAEKKPIFSRQKALKSFSVISDLAGVKDALERLSQGSHLLFNYESDDSSGVKLAKASAAAAVELLPIPLIEAADRGWEVDQEEKKFLKTMLESGNAGGWETHPAASMARVSTKIITRTVASMTTAPLLSGLKALEVGTDYAADSFDNYLAEFNNRESKELQQAKRKGFAERKEKFYLDKIYANIKRGEVINRDRKLNFYALKNEDWDKNLLARWEIQADNGQLIILKQNSSSSSRAEEIEFIPKNLAPAQYRIYLRIFDPLTMLQYNYAEFSFSIADYIDLGRLKLSRNGFDGPAADVLKIGDEIYLSTSRIGNWSDQYRVEWFYDAVMIESAQASDQNIHQIYFKTDSLEAGRHQIALRIIDSTNKIISHRTLNFSLGDYDNKQLKEDKVEGIETEKEEETAFQTVEEDAEMVDEPAVKPEPSLLENDSQSEVEIEEIESGSLSYSESEKRLNEKMVEIIKNIDHEYSITQIQTEVESMLQRGADPNYRDGIFSSNYTPLHRAVMLGRIETAEILINHGADVNALTADYTKSSTALLAVTASPTDISRRYYAGKQIAILEDRGEDEDVIYREIGEYINYLMLEMLIKHGADLNLPEYDSNGIRGTVLSRAVEMRYPHIVELLLKEGAVKHVENVNYYRFNSLQEFVEHEIDEYNEVLANNKYPENVRGLEYKINNYKKVLKLLYDYQVQGFNK